MMTCVELGRRLGLDVRRKLTGRVDGCHVVLCRLIGAVPMSRAFGAGIACDAACVVHQDEDSEWRTT